ncbi:unnamed protein product [Phytomonas sp. Hart1]|nr:unnamed protein product [Phytomonas sp. Hart1]|eukprot:CCW66072.1 unnamed protein product [Phytomonas sp. isolate Hart1]
MRGGKAPPPGLRQQLREWAQGSWKTQPELAGVVQAAEGALSSPAPFSPEMAPHPVIFHEDLIFDLPMHSNEAANVSSKTVQERNASGSLLSQASQMVELYQRELRSFDNEREKIERLCKEHGVSCEVFDPAIISRTHNEWEQLIEAYRQWIPMLADIESIYQAIRTEQEVLGKILNDTQHEDQVSEKLKGSSNASDEKISYQWQELNNYTTAWQSGLKAMQALRDTLQDLERKNNEAGDALLAKESSLKELQNVLLINTEAQSTSLETLQSSLQGAVDELAASEKAESAALISADQTQEHLNALEKKLHHLKSIVCAPEEINENELAFLFDHVRVAAQELSNLSEISNSGVFSEIRSELVGDTPIFDEKIIPKIFNLLSERSQQNFQDNDTNTNDPEVIGNALRKLLISELPNGDRLASVSSDVWQAVVEWLTKEAKEAREKSNDHTNALLNMDKEINLLTDELSES